MGVFDEDVRERRALVSSARKRIGGSRSRRCSLPSDGLSAAQRGRLNGPVRTYALGRPMSWEQFSRNPVSILFIWEGGIAIYGAVIGGAVGAWIYARKKKISFACMSRSMRMDALDRLCDRFAALAHALELELCEIDRSPAWEKIPDGPFARTYFDFFRAYKGIEASGVVVHAGLECGLLQSRIGKDAEFISIGPNMKHIHTVEECMELASFADLYSLLLGFLKTL